MIYFPSFNERSFRKRAHRFTSPFIYPHAVVSYFALFGIIVVEHDQYLLRIIEWTAHRIDIFGNRDSFVSLKSS